jgi:glycosyltransferase involved in cell wall biosynthesis
MVTHYFGGHGGGIELVAERLARECACLGEVAVHWMAAGPARDVPGVTCTPMAVWDATERLLGFPFPIPGPRSVLRLWRAVAAARVVWLHDYLYPANMLAQGMAILLGRPVIVTQHIGYVPYRSAILRNLLTIANRTLGTASLRAAAQAIFISDAVRGYFVACVKFRTAPMLWPNGVDAELFHPPPRGEHARAVEPTILFVGRFVEKKGLAIIEQLARLLPGYRFVLAGWGPQRPEHWELPNVRVVTKPAQREVADLYRHADCLLLPSQGEGFPLVVQEAMASGLRVVTSDEVAHALPGVADLVEWVPRESHHDIAAWNSAIDRALMPHAGRSGGGDAVRFARERWSWAALARQYSHLIQALSSAALRR